MKRLLLVRIAFLALAASRPTAEAAPIVFDFTYSGSLVNFTVPTTGAHHILAFGAQGGSSFDHDSYPRVPPSVSSSRGWSLSERRASGGSPAT